uniref:Uncharacterized protein n=1 Tax=Romanomermis culicivorax TaxID=13658 RepID=A0A915I448_ROMCU
MSFETSSTNTVEMVAFKVPFWGKNPICQTSLYSGGEISMFLIMPYASKWIALRTGNLFIFWRSVRNWVPTRAYIPTQSSAPSKETMMVWSPSTWENNAVQSFDVVNGTKKDMVLLAVQKRESTPRGNGSLGDDVTLTGESCQLDQATISS